MRIVVVLAAAASLMAMAGPAFPSERLVMVDGTIMEVAEYEVRGNLVVVTTLDGKLLSIQKDLVALEASRNPESPPPSVLPARLVTPDVPRTADATTVSRDAQGHTTLRAVRITEPVVVDGYLDDPIYERVPAANGFIQQEPREGEPATEPTDTWFFFDDTNIYIAARCWDSHPERIMANEMRRGNVAISRNDNFTIVMDTFHDGRNAFFFQTNPLGALYDALITDERNENIDWDTVWNSKATRFDRGWMVEIVIPFKSLRYREGREQVWGINLRRVVQWKNERSFLAPIAASHGLTGIYLVSQAATLVGLEAPTGSRNLEIKPYAIGGVTTDNQAVPRLTNDPRADAGLDAKYGLTKGLTADLTYNTDFAQVEVDEQQVNLTRFSLFYPEKRSFFLEGQGIFDFGGGGGPPWAPVTDTPLLFFSRRIGLSGGDPVPILAGARVTGRAGAYTLGALNIQTDKDEAIGVESTNYSVFRLRRDVFARSTVGLIGTHRSRAAEGTGSNQAFGVDARFAFFENMVIDAYYAESRTPERSGDQTSDRFQIANLGDRYGFEYEFLKVGDDFNPEIGFVRRLDFRRNRGMLRFSPRPARIAAVRKFIYQGDLDYTTNLEGRLETRLARATFGIEFQSGDKLNVDYTRNFEFLEEPFPIGEDVVIPVGPYDFQSLNAYYELGRQRRYSGRINFSRGSFYDGHRTEVGYSGRLGFATKFSVEPLVSINWIDLPQGSFRTTLLRSRFIYTPTTRMFLGALFQFNSEGNALLSNIRFRWEYEPGSDLYVVYSEGRDTGFDGFPVLQNRTLVVKLTKLFRF